jgi:hypothetical protein
VGAKGLCLAGPLRSGETSRPDSRDPVASGVKCGPRGCKKSKTKSSIGAGAALFFLHVELLHKEK